MHHFQELNSAGEVMAAKRAKSIELALRGSPEKRIFTVRGQLIVLDADLAEFYGVTTTRLMQQVGRNKDRFQDDFMFRPTDEELDEVTAQIDSADRAVARRRSGQAPAAFTEHGALAAAGVLRSGEAAEVSVALTRAFVAMRRQIAALEATSPVRGLVARSAGSVCSPVARRCLPAGRAGGQSSPAETRPYPRTRDRSEGRSYRAPGPDSLRR